MKCELIQEIILDDPVLNTFVSSSDSRLAGLLFHELAHQLIYIADDTSFNEAFAMTVQIEGVRRWFQQNSKEEEWQRFLDHQKQGEIFQNYLHTTREQLSDLYRHDISVEQMRSEKQLLIAKALDHFETTKESGQLGNGFDRWMAHGLNNARLAGIATYRELIHQSIEPHTPCHFINSNSRRYKTPVNNIIS